LPTIWRFYLKQKYSVTNRKSGKLQHLIKHHAEDLGNFLGEIFSKDLQVLAENLSKRGGYRRPGSKKKTRVKPQTEAERGRRLKDSKNRYEELRREYRDGLIEEQFGRQQITTLDPSLASRPTGACLDILFSGGTVKMCGCSDSLENLFGVDRHRFPKSLPRERSGRTVVYRLDAFQQCLIHLLENRSDGEQWPREPSLRELVLRGIIERAHRFSSEAADMLAGKLRPFLS
jgi:hypothetical protein